MSDDKKILLLEGYNPNSLAQAVSQLQDFGKALNPAPLSQAIQQIIQGSGNSSTQPSSSPGASAPAQSPSTEGSKH